MGYGNYTGADGWTFVKGKGKGKHSAAPKENEAPAVLWGSRSPEWSCAHCYFARNWACRIACQQCAKAAPNNIRARAKEASDKAVKKYFETSSPDKLADKGDKGKGKGKQ